jgi:ribosomal-protein-alanine N-acetyltransferase
MNSSEVYNKFPVLKFDNIILREFISSDVEQFFSYINHPEVKKFLSSDDVPNTYSEAQKELAYWKNLFYQKFSIYWGIAESNTNKLIGSCGFNNWNIYHKRVEISYDLDHDYWNKGIMTKVLNEICSFAFDKLDVYRIQATVIYENNSSIRVLEKLGFKREGLLENYAVNDGKITNSYIYAKVKVCK